MRHRRLRHKSLVLCERLAKQWRNDGDKRVHVAKTPHGFYFVAFDKDEQGGLYF